jgi:uncharacterized protein YdeI (YjbR/CyaY-like superfamily)
MDPSVDQHIARAKRWQLELQAVRTLLLDCGLDESLKWGKPCYAHDGSNVAILQSMKGFLALLFFKGVLLRDPEGVLEEQGENTHAARRVCFTSLDRVRALDGAVRALVAEAVRVEDAGVPLPEPPPVVWADELQARLAADAALKAAFEGLTPGRQREYNLHFSGAKRSATRTRRVAQQVERILAGKGLRDR